MNQLVLEGHGLFSQLSSTPNRSISQHGSPSLFRQIHDSISRSSAAIISSITNGFSWFIHPFNCAAPVQSYKTSRSCSRIPVPYVYLSAWLDWEYRTPARPASSDTPEAPTCSPCIAPPRMQLGSRRTVPKLISACRAPQLRFISIRRFTRSAEAQERQRVRGPGSEAMTAGYARVGDVSRA